MTPLDVLSAFGSLSPQTPQLGPMTILPQATGQTPVGAINGQAPATPQPQGQQPNYNALFAQAQRLVNPQMQAPQWMPMTMARPAGQMRLGMLNGAY